MKHLITLVFFAFQIGYSQTNPMLNDTTKTYATPLLTKSLKGEVILSWTEKDSKGSNAFCMATSQDNGQSFGDKQVIFESLGLGNSRLMRARLLFKKDGTLVAVFSNRADVGGKRAIDLVLCQSKDQGKTWTAPQLIDTDPTPCVRGFFDAVVLPNDELAVVYLKDVAGSTKHEERNLRLVLTQNGVFQAEKVIDSVVCDCCNVSMLLDAKGKLHVYYRDNNNDVRDIAKMTSTDNGLTFSNPEILHNDNWKIAGCPHSGAVSGTFGSSNLITWFSGGKTEKGLRLVTQEGKKLSVVSEPSAKNAYVATQANQAVFLWEQNNPQGLSSIAYQKINADKISETSWLNDSVNATNASGLVLKNQLIVAYEVKQPNKRNVLKVSRVDI